MSDEWQKAIDALTDLTSFINYCIETNESEWAVDVVRTKGNKQNCLFGHLVNWHHGNNYQGKCTEIWDSFEEMWSSTFYVYDVNDGKNEKYQQATPKERCIAYLKDLWLGLEMPIWKYYEIQTERARAEMAAEK